MFAKIFQQIFDSSIAENWQYRVVFQDLLILADKNGIVDITHEALARRTGVPLRIIRQAIRNLEADDPKSRSTAAGGARIVRLDQHRDWGWVIINYTHYRQIASEEQRREKTAARVRKFRERHGIEGACNAPVTPDNAGNARQRQRQRQRQKDSSKTQRFKALSGKGGVGEGESLAALLALFTEAERENDGGKWRNRSRENPGRFDRVTQDLCLAKREGRRFESWAAVAEERWKEFH